MAFSLLILFPPQSHARVFWSWKSRTTAENAFDFLGAKSVYRSRLEINGGPGNLEVFACPSGIRDTVAGIRQRLGANAVSHSGGSMAFGEVTDGNDLLRLVIVQLSARSETLVFSIAQSQDSRAASLVPVPITDRIPAVPSYPGSRPAFFVADQDRQCALGVASTSDSPEGVRRFYADRMAADGWKPAIRGTDKANATGMTVFLRKEEILCCQADEGPGGETRITLLHKRQGLN